MCPDVPLLSVSFVHSLSTSQVFPAPTDEGNDLDDRRETEGPTVREMMEMERAARISRETGSAANA